MAAPVLVFDLDGTLVDSAPDLIDTLNLIMSRIGVEPLPFAEGRALIGGGAKLLIERALARRHTTTRQSEIDELFEAFIAHYAEHIADRSRPFPGLEIALDRLAADGFRLAVCTNKLEWLARRLLDALDLTPRFAFICGQDTFATRKPDPQVLRLTVDKAGGGTEGAIMVGDSITDIRTAQAAGVPVIAVDFGYTDIPVSELGADRVISHFAELRDAVSLLRNKAGK
jgi:phosphoglycolate phosphatase